MQNLNTLSATELADLEDDLLRRRQDLDELCRRRPELRTGWLGYKLDCKIMRARWRLFFADPDTALSRGPLPTRRSYDVF